MAFRIAVSVAVSLLVTLCVNAAAEEKPVKTAGVLFSKELAARVRSNAGKYPWAAAIRDRIVIAAEPWKSMSNDELWSAVFGPGITRSWMVWSNGFCPSCKKGVEMYTWKVDPFKTPWKFRCPHCDEFFPKNDYGKYYLSGLNEQGVFDPKRADRSLLFNTEHPDPADPLHVFGVDDGEGYVDGDKRWRFVGAYLIYGQWKRVVLGGISRLAAAYVVTGDQVYAHKAGVLLDRVADVYPSFDYISQGLVYEKPSGNGYVCIWHDACEDARQLATIYDWVFDGIRDDPQLIAFLSAKAQEHKLSNPKSSFADIQRNIETNILRDQIANQHKIYSNYPRTDIALAYTHTALGWPGNREQVTGIIDGLLAKGTTVDGLTGEKGLADYSAQGVMVMGSLLAQYARVDPSFLKEMLARHPKLAQTFRFHLDTWCLGHYYPQVGDTGWFGGRFDEYRGATFAKPESDSDEWAFYWSQLGLDASAYAFLWSLYEATGDVAYVQALYKANGSSVEGLPYELAADDPTAFEKKVAGVIGKVGTEIKLPSVNKQGWRLAILRSGGGKDARALWLNYESGGGHGHADGMNLGLFAKGLDLLPDFGYPPVNFGGWDSERAAWYKSTAAHNTVTVDGQNQAWAAGTTTLWADGRMFHAVGASGPAMIGGSRYERTAALVDISDKDCYALDIFRVAGGSTHDRFTGSFFGIVSASGLDIAPVPDYGQGMQIRHLGMDASPQSGWSVDWKIEDRYKYLPPGTDVHLRLTDLTCGASAGLAEAWVTWGGYFTNNEAWVPRVLARRTGEAPLASTFVSVLEPYEEKSNIASIRRLPMERESDVAVEIRLADGRRDLILAADGGMSSRPALIKVLDWNLATDCELCVVRLTADGGVERAVLVNGRYVGINDVSVKLKEKVTSAELMFEDGKPVDETRP